MWEVDRIEEIIVRLQKQKEEIIKNGGVNHNPAIKFGTRIGNEFIYIQESKEKCKML